MSWETMRGGGVTTLPSPLESRRFGLSIGRVVVGTDAVQEAAAVALTSALASADEEVLIVRWPSSLLTLGAAAARSGRRIIAADSLTYWEVAPSRCLSGPRDPMDRLDLVLASSSDTSVRDVIESIVVDSFAAYGNHYAANPLLDPAMSQAGYVEWAQAALDRPEGDVLLLKSGMKPIGIATVGRSHDGLDLEIHLCGLVSSAQGRGWYGHLLAGVVEAARAWGRERVIISTQVHNVRPQRVWARLGFQPFAAFTTVHALREAGKGHLG